MSLTRTLALAVTAALALPALAGAAPPVAGGYQENDFSGGRAFNIVPPGQNGRITALDAAAFLLDGTRPPHQADQNDMYANLVYETPGLKKSQILDFFKDASFGVKLPHVERTYTPTCLVVTPPSANSPHCDDVRIVRDQYGIPHVYGQDRAALMFGLGYITGEDRLFLADALRHAGRSNLSSFVGGANVGQDHDTFSNAPYAGDAELMTQYEQADDIYGQQGVQVQEDVQNYTDGMNQWIAEAALDPVNKLDALYAATNHPEGPQPWEVTDVIATGTLVAGVFGKGGGGELGAATSLQAAKRVLGKRKGSQVWRDFRSADDPEAPRTVHKRRFPYRVPHGRRGIAMPDPGSLENVPLVPGGGGMAASQRDPEGALLDGLEDILSGSNALVVSARESQSGHPLAVFGPQTGYFAPQLLMEQDAHAPGGPEGPAIHARGVSFVGTNLYVQLGRGVDYAWSATSAGQDIIDTFAVKLCEPGGGATTAESRGYRWNGQCLAMDVLEHTNSWTPSAADMTPAGSETMRMYRTNVGLLTHVGTINDVPYGFTKHRATYKREVDAAGAFADWNSPQKVHNARSWIRSGYKNDLTFNWFYVDDEHIAYYNSGANPKRAKGTHPNFPVLARKRFLWRKFNPELNTFKREALRRHAQVIDQAFLSSWNNKHARGYRCDGIRCYGAVYRVDQIDRNIRKGIKGSRKMTLPELIDAMELAGTVDTRGLSVVPWALRVIGKKGLAGDLKSAVATLRAWVKKGSHRLDKNNDGNYDHADAVKIIDAWWPLWVEGQFKPTLGDELHAIFIGTGSSIHDRPGSIGSAFNHDMYGYVQKDLRSALGARVRAPYSRVYCGKGKLSACRKMLRATLAEAAGKSFEDVYGTGGCTLNNGTAASEQMCDDAVNASDVTVAAVNEFHWINRPTFQQAIEYRDGR